MSQPTGPVCPPAGPLPPGADCLEVCHQLLDHFRLEASQYRIGRTRLFFRAGVLGQLEDAAARMQRCALRNTGCCMLQGGKAGVGWGNAVSHRLGHCGVTVA